MQLSSPGKSPHLKRSARFAMVVALLCGSFFSLQCKKEMTTTTSSSAKLSFGGNLIFFDTVFVTRGSSVRVFVVHNNNNQAVVTNIKLQGSYLSPFEINVDGVPGTAFNNIKIPANDSIFIFTQVNVNPLDSNNPVVILDSLVFTTNGNVQSVYLQAYGWNAYYYYPNITPKTGPAYYQVACGEEWKNDKPHVLFGYLRVPPGCKLTVDAGAKIYMHDSAIMLVDSAATLDINGTSSQPVTMQGDRLEPDYKYLPGQWGEILLYKSTNCNISWAVLQNGSNGIQVDTLAPSGAGYSLQMDHTIIKGMSGYGLLLEGAVVYSNNCLVADCQSSCLAMVYGGKYGFYQCTFADYWGVVNSYGQRATPLLYINNNYLSGAAQKVPRDIDSAFFGNCIIYGALSEEIGLDSNYGAKFNYFFQSCVLKTQHSTSSAYHYNAIYLNDPLFASPTLDDYIVNGGSPASGKANSSIASRYPVSLDRQHRPNIGATIGAYEQ